MAEAESKNIIDEEVQDGTDSTGSPIGNHSIDALHDGTDHGKKQFLDSFTASEDKAIMRKVDMRFLWLIGITYLIKNSNASPPPPKKKPTVSNGCRWMQMEN